MYIVQYISLIVQGVQGVQGDKGNNSTLYYLTPTFSVKCRLFGLFNIKDIKIRFIKKHPV